MLKIMLFLNFFYFFYVFIAFAQPNNSPTINQSLRTPNVSANALFLYRNTTSGKFSNSIERNGLDIQETEIAFYSDVDPYSSLNVILSIAPEYEYDATTDTVIQDWIIEPEEAFALSNYFSGITFKLGKFKAEFGKHNLLHSHAYPFVDAPITNDQLLGGEGLNDVGASAAILLPFKSFYSELTVQYLRGEGENSEFSSKNSNDGISVMHWKNLMDLSDSFTMEIGGSYAEGNNSMNAKTKLIGGDLTFKYIPLSGGKVGSLTLAGEFIGRNQEQKNLTTSYDDENGKGFSIWAQYQFTERWSLLTRYESFEVKNSEALVNENALINDKTIKKSLAFNFNATEFSSFKFECDRLEGPPMNNGKRDENRIFLQANFTIGSHPVHSY